MGAAPEVWVAGRPLTSLCTWGDLEVTHRWPYGSWQVTWEMSLKPYQRPVGFKDDAPTVVKIGSWPLWAGNLLDLGWGDGRFAAVGAARQGEQAICLDGTGKTTSITDTAVDQGIARGVLTWTRPASLSAAAFGTAETDKPNYVTALLDMVSASLNQRWWVDPTRAVRFSADPTTPFATIRPDVAELGVSLETQAATVLARYLDSATGLYTTVSVGAGRPELPIALTDAGPITATQATNICQAIWSRLQAQTGWTEGITVMEGQLLRAGVPLALSQFTAGMMVQLLNVRDTRGLSANTNVIIGESVWRPSAKTLQLNPVGMAARSEDKIIEDVVKVLLPV